jgi:ribosomal protein S6
MNRRYEGMYILDVQGKEEGVEEVFTRIRKGIEFLGGGVEATQRMGQRQFECGPGKLASGYYLGITFLLDPSKIKELESSFRLDAQVYRQVYFGASAKSPSKEQKEKAVGDRKPASAQSY